MLGTNQNLQKLTPVLVYMQTHLDQELSLAQLAEVGNLSPFHFQRLFLATIGETPKAYVQRLRLERAAYQLKIREDTVLEVALNNGYLHHETFSRAFKRWFGVSPQQYRLSYGRALHDHALHGRALHGPPPPQQAINQLVTEYALSSLSIQRLHPLPVAFIRNLGAYTAVDASRYDDLLHWADCNGLYTGDNLLLGVGHDDPGITPADKVRFDMCLTVPDPFLPDGEIGYQELPGGYYATASYIGPFGPPLEGAYAHFFRQLVRMKNVEIIGLPVLEIYRMTHVNPAYALNHVDIYVPVQVRPA